MPEWWNNLFGNNAGTTPAYMNKVQNINNAANTANYAYVDQWGNALDTAIANQLRSQGITPAQYVDAMYQQQGLSASDSQEAIANLANNMSNPSNFYGQNGTIDNFRTIGQQNTGAFTNSDGTFNWNNIGSAVSGGLNLGLGAINAYAGWQNMKTAKDAFNFNKQLATTNLNNSIKSYNTKLGDVARTRSIMETGSDGAYSDWYNQNKATGLNGE